jgi:hypothetical protein
VAIYAFKIIKSKENFMFYPGFKLFKLGTLAEAGETFTGIKHRFIPVKNELAKIWIS